MYTFTLMRKTENILTKFPRFFTVGETVSKHKIHNEYHCGEKWLNSRLMYSKYTIVKQKSHINNTNNTLRDEQRAL